MGKEYQINTPFKIGKKTMRNRIVFPPMETRMNTIMGDTMPEAIDYYETRAKGGCGLIIVENTFIDNKESRSSSASSGLWSDHLMPRKAMLAEAVHDHGCLAIIQISHGGRQCSAVSTGLQPIAPSPIPCPVTRRIPREITREEILRVQEDFAKTADRAKRAGFDGVEIHGAHGYLLAGFMSPGANQRTDEYGGFFENRLRMPRETIEKVREAVGEDFIIGFRISVNEFVGEQGLEPDEACRFVKAMEHLLDYVHCSAGTYATKGQGICQPVYQPAGKLLPLAAQMKKTVNIPVIAVGSMDFKIAEDALEKGYCDLVAIGRQQIADPEFGNKVMQGHFDDVRPCCRANEGCQSGFFKVYPIRCELNPAAGREARYKIKKAKSPGRVVILGGGCAGLEAARAADLAGHHVMLLEKSGKLGGHMNEAVLPPFKSKTGEFFEWQVRQVKEGKTNIILNADVSPENVAALKPDLLIIAVGSKYIVPTFKTGGNVLNADEVLFHQDRAGRKTAIVGGGLIGCEIAMTLAENGGCDVTIIEMLNGLNKEMDYSARQTMLERMNNDCIKILLQHKVHEVTEAGVVCQDANGDKKTVEADSVIIAMGMKADEESAASYETLGLPCVRIGDCESARNFAACTEDAWRTIIRFTDRHV